MKIRVTTIASAACCAAGLVLSTAPANAQDMDDKAMERRVRHMSVAIGNAYACTEKEARGAFKEESHLLFDLIVQDMGSDMAFLYATGIGYGSSLPKEKLDCPTLLKQWEEIREDYELKEDK